MLEAQRWFETLASLPGSSDRFDNPKQFQNSNFQKG